MPQLPSRICWYALGSYTCILEETFQESQASQTYSSRWEIELVLQKHNYKNDNMKRYGKSNWEALRIDSPATSTFSRLHHIGWSLWPLFFVIEPVGCARQCVSRTKGIFRIMWCNHAYEKLWTNPVIYSAYLWWRAFSYCTSYVWTNHKNSLTTTKRKRKFLTAYTFPHSIREFLPCINITSPADHCTTTNMQF